MYRIKSLANWSHGYFLVLRFIAPFSNLKSNLGFSSFLILDFPVSATQFWTFDQLIAKTLDELNREIWLNYFIFDISTL